MNPSCGITLDVDGDVAQERPEDRVKPGPFRSFFLDE